MAMNGMGRTGETGRNQQIGVLRPLSLMLTASWYMGEDGASVVSAQADVFAKNLTKIGKILRIFDELDEVKSRWVLCQS